MSIGLRVVLRACIAFIALSFLGCTFAPPRNDLSADAKGRFNTHTFAVVLRCTRSRAATGLSAFPDGGTPLILRRAALIYRCEADSGTARLLAKVEAPEDLWESFHAAVDGWDVDSFYVTLSGSPRQVWFVQPSQEIRARHLKFLPDGTFRAVDSVPQNLTHTPDLGIFEKNERVLLRLRCTRVSIEVCTDLDEGYREAFRLDQANCRLSSMPHGTEGLAQ